MAEGVQPIIIKKIKKGGHAHHGGAWKVAYADFVTAMMAFFLLLWLLNSVTQEQLEGVADYFAPASLSESTSGAGGVLGGQTVAVPGSMENATSRLTEITAELPPPRAGSGGSAHAGEDGEVSEEQLEELMKEKEEEQFKEAEKEIKDAIKSIPSMKDLGKSLMIDNTPEGMRIQIVDQEGLAMFPSGSEKMYHHTRRILELVAKVINSMPQDLSITGHTDATPYMRADGKGNWELSSARANSCRRTLLDLGVSEDRVGRVVGMAARDPLLTNDPKHPKNRRISIVLLRGTGQERLEAEKKRKTPPSVLSKPLSQPAIKK